MSRRNAETDPDTSDESPMWRKSAANVSESLASETHNQPQGETPQVVVQAVWWCPTPEETRTRRWWPPIAHRLQPLARYPSRSSCTCWAMSSCLGSASVALYIEATCTRHLTGPTCHCDNGAVKFSSAEYLCRPSCRCRSSAASTLTVGLRCIPATRSGHARLHAACGPAPVAGCVRAVSTSKRHWASASAPAHVRARRCWA